MIYIYTSIAILIISLISFVGIFTLSLSTKRLKAITLYLVSLSAGSLLGGALLHLLPEILVEKNNAEIIWFSLLGGIIAFFILEKIVCWRHCHIPTSHDHPHPLGIMNLIGDGLHNFLDGVLIAGSFMMSIEIGIATSIAVMFHEIPQEIGDFGVLIHAGYSRAKALFLNFAIALTALFGGLITIYFGNNIQDITSYIIPFTAGGFIYIATADLIPELKKDHDLKKSSLQLLFILIGIGIMFALKMFGGE